MSDNTHKIIIAFDAPLSFAAVKAVLPAEYSIQECHDQNELFTKLVQHPDSYTAVIIPAANKYLALLRQINTCGKTKIIPVVLQADDKLSSEEVNILLRAGGRYHLPSNLAAEQVKLIMLAAIRDRKRHLAAGNDLSAEQSSLIMQSGEFKFQRLEECQSLASFFANACPNPRLAVIGIVEILINAIEHGNLGISYLEKTKLQSSDDWMNEVERRINLPENKHKYASASFIRTPDHLQIKVKDAGVGFDWNKFQYLDSARVHDSHGRGIIMAKNLAFDKLEYSAKGNEVNCYIKLGA